jgi:hypothetical protein
MREPSSSRDEVIIEKADDRKGMDMDTYLMMMKCENTGNDRNREEIVTTLLISGIDLLEMTIVDMRGMIGRGDTMVTETGTGTEIKGGMMIEIEIEIEIADIPVTGIEIEIVGILTVIAIDGDSTCTFAYWR